MKCDEIQERLVDLWDGAASSAVASEIEEHLSTCSSCESEARELEALWSELGALPEAEPGPGLRARFEVMLEAYRAGQGGRSGSILDRIDGWLERTPLFARRRRPAFQLGAALVLFALGALAGLRLGAAPAPADPLSALSEEVSDLRNLVTLSLMQQASPSERLRGVSFSYRLSDPQPDVLEALTRTLEYDPNVNVRLAAIDALTRFGERDTVREALHKSLPEQESPLVQIALIDLMVQLRDQDSVELLRALAAEPELHPAVRERARWGLDQIG